MTGSWRLCLVLVTALSAAGCGGSGGAPPAAPQVMRFVATAPPAGATPGRGPVSLAFVTPRRGFAATTGGSRDVAREGWVLPSAPGEIERTRDGGATWRTLWRGRLSFDALAVRRRVVVAAGLRERETGRHDPWFTPLRRHVLVISRDGGRTWTRRRLPADAQACRGGAHDADGRRKQLWRTSDGGATWRPVAGTCASPYAQTDLDFVTPGLAFVAQGDPDIPSSGVLRRSENGGATWTTIVRERGRAPLRVQFSDRRHGTVVEGVDGPGPQKAHFLLATTADGGHTWARHGLPADSVDTDDATTPVPAILGRDVWVGHTRGGVVWHTSDGGLRWSLATAPRFLDPGSGGYLQTLLTGPGMLMVASAAGPVESRDGGRTWTPARWPSARDTARDEGRGAYVVPGFDRDRVRLVTPTGSRPLSLPPGVRYVADAAFANARGGVVVARDANDHETLQVTHDTGGSWAPVAPPGRRAGDYALAPGLVVAFTDTTASVTTDDGASWQSLGRLPKYADCSASRPSALDAWITCAGWTRVILFRSGDGGRTWTRRVTGRDLDRGLSGTGGPEAWATQLIPAPDGDATSALWHTTDGGATWVQVWVRLPPRAPAREVDCAVMPSGVLHAPLAGCR